MATLKRAIHAALFALVALAQTGFAAEEPPLTLKGLSGRDRVMFMIGAAMALNYSNGALTRAGDKPLYCPPEQALPGATAMWELAEKRLAGEWEVQDFMAGLIHELRATYPCQK